MQNASSKQDLDITALHQALDDPHVLEMLGEHGSIVHFKAGDIILQQGKKAPGMFIILQGAALVTAKILGEGGAYINNVGPGNIIGEISLIENGPCTTSVVASSPVECLLISRPFYEMLSQFFPAIKHQITLMIVKEVWHRVHLIKDKITSFITHVDMTERPLFAELVRSLTKPTVLKHEEIETQPNDLLSITNFARFTPQELEQFLKLTTLIQAPKHCTLIQENEKNVACYILLRGAVQSSIVQGSKAAKLFVLGPVNFFTALSYLEKNEEAVIEFTTCEKAILLKIEADQLDYIAEHHLKLWYKISDLICKSLIEIEKGADKLDIRLNSEIYNR